MVKAKKSEYTDNEGNIIREKLIQVKERVKLALEEKAVNIEIKKITNIFKILKGVR